MSGPRNVDMVREFVEGVRKDANGDRVPTPFRCNRCPEDGCYFNGTLWLCTEHWQQEWQEHLKAK